ncbi:MAG: class I SAM-dependent methyltransferase [Chloroflexi bacterium]|nr:class I SAM-dependent methyltransferase [Chloroflexota bacterium]
MNTEQLVSENSYRYLPRFYDEAGFSEYASVCTPRFMNFLQENGWLGRRILDLGCGTGVSTKVFAEAQKSVTAVDSSAEMLARAEARFQDTGFDIEFVRQSAQAYKPVGNSYDLVYALDLLNHVTSIRDIEAIFQRANYALQMEKQFLFDLQTIRDLAEGIGNRAQILHNSEGLFIVAKNAFHYDTLSLRQEIDIFNLESEGLFRRAQEVHILRGYPFRAVVSMLRRTGFEIEHLIDPVLNTYAETSDLPPRIVVVLRKMRDLVNQ